jgi:hypothetical protein
MQKAGDVVQLVRTLPCHGRGREFESRRPRQLTENKELIQQTADTLVGCLVLCLLIGALFAVSVSSRRLFS